MKKANTELTHTGRKAKLTLAQGRRGAITLKGNASFTPEEFVKWLGRATWYVNDLMAPGRETAPVENETSLMS